MVITCQRRSILWITLIFILGACAHHQPNVGETAAPVNLSKIDCVKLVVAGHWPVISEHLDYCKNYKNSEGISTLMMSVYKDQWDIFQNLIAAGSDIHQVDESGSDALFYAINFQRLKMVQRLRESGARVTMNAFKVNSLWVALQRSSAQLIKVLQPTNEEVNLKGDDGWTALYFAIRREEKEIFDLILAAGAQTNIRDSEGASPYLFAKDEVKWDYATQKLALVTEPAYKKKN